MENPLDPKLRADLEQLARKRLSPAERRARVERIIERNRASESAIRSWF